MPVADKQSIAENIISLAFDTLSMQLKPFRHAFAELRPEISKEISSIHTDGTTLFCPAEETIRQYLNDKSDINRVVLHSVFHCMFMHLYKTDSKDAFLWNLACDISVENAIIEYSADCTHSLADCDRIRAINTIRESTGTITAESIYAYFLDNEPDESETELMLKLFYRDDHTVWYRKRFGNITEDSYSENGETPSIYKRADDRPAGGEEEKGQTSGDNGERNEDGEKWERISKKVSAEAEFEQSQMGNNGGSYLQELEAIQRDTHNYAEFLRQFTVQGEQIKTDDSEFDYIYYTYGLSLFKNMPLIEPLEYKDDSLIKNFIIAIDTSGSVKGHIVQKFIEKTYNILKNSDLFAEHINLHIIQCDAVIQEDAVIHSQAEFDDYIKNMKLHGFGGTDFRPVFKYADTMLTEKSASINGLIYFTDGDGVYPETAPKFKTAFILYGNNIKANSVPKWACKHIMTDNAIMR